jgi:hypothetical protein
MRWRRVWGSEKRMGTVYFFKAIDNTKVKIGFTKGGIKTRLSSIQHACPFELEIFGQIHTSEPKKIEKEIHDELSNYRLNGEWFDVPLKTLNDVITRYSPKESNYEELIFDNGTRAIRRLSDNKIFLAYSLFTKTQQMIYMATAECIFFEDDVPFVALDELKKDYPELHKHIQQFEEKCQREWPIKKCPECNSRVFSIISSGILSAHLACKYCKTTWFVPLI